LSPPLPLSSAPIKQINPGSPKIMAVKMELIEILLRVSTSSQNSILPMLKFVCHKTAVVQ